MKPASFEHACVASPHHLASEVGREVLATGGNAVDAAVAINLTLGVVTPYLCGYGGDMFAMIWDGELHAYNGSGRSPAKATPQSVGTATMPVFGRHPITVPGAVRGWFDLLDRFGTRSFEELSEPALRFATDGFSPSEVGVRSFEAGNRIHGSGWNAAYANPSNGVVQPALARTIHALIDNGSAAYYRGPIAQAISEATQDWISPTDLEAHSGDWVTPISTDFRGLTVYEMPPNTQGITALQALAIADGYALSEDVAQRTHELIEISKLALIEREADVSDPVHMKTNADAMLEAGHIESLRNRINAKTAAPMPVGDHRGGTAYMCAADADGMLVSLIQSNYMGFGSGVSVADWGINLHNRGAHFRLDEDHVNCIAPNKRPMHTLIPAMAFCDGRPKLVFGTMGGDGQAQTHLQLLVRIAIDQSDIASAIDAPRFAVSPHSGNVAIEGRFGPVVLDDLTSRGHDLSVLGDYDSHLGHAHAIEVTPDGYQAATDPRTEGATCGL